MKYSEKTHILKDTIFILISVRILKEFFFYPKCRIQPNIPSDGLSWKGKKPLPCIRICINLQTL